MSNLARNLDQSTGEIIEVDPIRAQLSIATTPQETKAVRDTAGALVRLARQRKVSRQEQNRLAQIVIDAERQLGEQLKVIERNRSGRPSEKSLHDEKTFYAVHSEMGISSVQAWRWQREADIPDEICALYFNWCNTQDREVTTAGLLRTWEAWRAADPRAQDVALRYEVGDDQNIKSLNKLWRGRNDTFFAAESSGYIQPGDAADAVHIATPYDEGFSDALKQLADNHAQDAVDERISRIRQFEGITFVNGSCLDHIDTLEENSVRLVLTDPPYGVGYVSGRRRSTLASDAIENDLTAEEAIDLFSAMLARIDAKLDSSAHLLIFTRWRTEFDFRRALTQAGYTIKGSLIWVKNNHTAGDLYGSFAPRHERIIHAVRGRPDVSPRCDDVLMLDAPPTQGTDHPAEKPLNLLQQLIEVTTAENELVVDPFAGIASTLVAAKSCGRSAWGCELDEGYWRVGQERLMDGAA